MSFLKKMLIAIWRIWFYTIFMLTIIIALPLLIITTSKESFYPAFFKIAKSWARMILFLMGFRVKLNKKLKLDKKQSYIFIANHTSIIDIMLMLSIVPNPFVFIGKAELAKYPIFGYFYRRTNILVDRSSMKSRKKAFEDAQNKIKMGRSICIFPEGMVPDDESVVLAPFKNGAFNIAIDHHVSIVPMVFLDCKKRFSYTFFSGKPGKLRVKILPFIKTTNLEHKDKKILKEKSYDMIYKELI
ncbi:lysophospholipid acyltransferase family protein [Aureivirga sp. CE67]|uniref:lysophospholipid acyltransferase family protein n=1 Tax=Aureivirga sp. CE67 TaxID=1788983 RepID=UPI0018C9AC27|nr:lysophospholipid acyltransferase family protein [Aureivirga sp. CE67]